MKGTSQELYSFKISGSKKNILKARLKWKPDQGSKAASRDHPNSSFMTRLDYIRVED